ncbi:MAG: chorismate-binding protein [Elusimicrobia bacterium]|nr:chorismate-binding protein [Elusimicrobiota bacterium]
MRVWTGFEGRWRFYEGAEAVIEAASPTHVARAFERMEEALARGRHLAGFFSFEAGYALDPALSLNRPVDFPLLRVGVFGPPRPERPVGAGPAPRLGDFRLNIERPDYDRRIAAIRDLIARGDVYQITYCIKNTFTATGDSRVLFATLLDEQPVPYPALIECDDAHILSLSPELFLKKTKDRLLSKPMKGTWVRGRTPWADLLARFRLKFDSKNRAENVMIADLLRNDLGRVGDRVRAPRLFEVTGYRTLYQMTSTVTARVPPAMDLRSFFAAIFPSGSVTGAPKIRAMQILRDLEPEDRRVYTGAIGYVTPGGISFQHSHPHPPVARGARRNGHRRRHRVGLHPRRGVGRRVAEVALFKGLPVRGGLRRFTALVLLAPLVLVVAPRPAPPAPDCPVCGHACCCPDLCRPLLKKYRAVPGRCDRESFCRSEENRPPTSLGCDLKKFPALDRHGSGFSMGAVEDRPCFLSETIARSLRLRWPPPIPPPRPHRRTVGAITPSFVSPGPFAVSRCGSVFGRFI